MFNLSGYFNRLKLGWQIGVYGYKTLLKNKKLVFFPICSAIFITFAIVVIFGGLISGGGDLQQGVIVLGLIIGYFFAIMLSIYFNVCMLSEADKCLKGNKVSITRGLKFGLGKFNAIFFWGLVSGTVGLILNILSSIEERLPFRIFTFFLDVAWAVTIYFVLPVICFEDITNPFKAIKSSKNHIKSAWGNKHFSKIIGASAVSFVIAIPVVVCFIILSNIMENIDLSQYAEIAVGSLYGICIFSFVILFTLNICVNIILRNIFYRYSESKFIPLGLSEEQVSHVIDTNNN